MARIARIDRVIADVPAKKSVIATPANPPPTRLYLWARCFILQAEHYLMDCRENPYRRLSVTLILAHRSAFKLAVNGQPPQLLQAAILAPNVQRDFIEAGDGGLTIFDVGMTAPGFLRLVSQVPKRMVGALSATVTRELSQLLAAHNDRDMSCVEVKQLFDAAVDIVCRDGAAARERDPRLQRVLERVEQLPLDQLSSPVLAQVAQLSESRLRALFNRQLDCTPSQYLRWAAAFKAADMWQRGVKLTEIAHAAGFYDLAHADRVARELFGMSPSTIIDPRKTRLFRCND